MESETKQNTGGKKQIVRVTADYLRERIFACPPDEQIDSLPEIARTLGVGIVTVQQAARILEHEGILAVRRGPGGGYYGRRPDLADLERVLRGYMRSDPASWKEVLDITSLLFNQLCAAAARCPDQARRNDLRSVAKHIAEASDLAQLAGLESELQNVLFRMVNRPLFELLTRVALSSAPTTQSHEKSLSIFGLKQWQDSRRRIITAILQEDPDLAHFEANRLNRQVLVGIAGLEAY
jgi:GntR family transcriptional repressor for pyruvate dehydrogenase complex